MFRELRRKERALSAEEAEKILKDCVYGVLSLQGDDGYPYGVPMNYGYSHGKIYLHGVVNKGHRMDSIRRSPKVCFTVISKHELVAEAFQMRYESVIVFGTIRVIEDPEEKKEAMRRLVASYISGYEKETDEHCVKTEKALAMFEITPEHITGKAGT